MRTDWDAFISTTVNAWLPLYARHLLEIERLNKRLWETIMAELTSRKRKSLPKASFAEPGKRKYPIHDKAHARNALARVSQHGTPAEKKKVRAAVHRRYPGIGKGK